MSSPLSCLQEWKVQEGGRPAGEATSTACTLLPLLPARCCPVTHPTWPGCLSQLSLGWHLQPLPAPGHVPSSAPDPQPGTTTARWSQAAGEGPRQGCSPGPCQGEGGQGPGPSWLGAHGPVAQPPPSGRRVHCLPGSTSWDDARWGTLVLVCELPPAGDGAGPLVSVSKGSREEELSLGTSSGPSPPHPPKEGGQGWGCLLSARPWGARLCPSTPAGSRETCTWPERPDSTRGRGQIPDP